MEGRGFVNGRKGRTLSLNWIACWGSTGEHEQRICQLYADDVVLVDNILVYQSERQVDQTRNSRQTTTNMAHFRPFSGAGGWLPSIVQERVGKALRRTAPSPRRLQPPLGQWFSRNRPVPKDFHSLRTYGSDNSGKIKVFLFNLLPRSWVIPTERSVMTDMVVG